MSLTWAQFNAAVRLQLFTYNDVATVQDLIDLSVKNGAADVQRTVEYYQSGHEETFRANDLTTQGFASLGSLPAGKVMFARLVKYDTTLAVLLPNVFRTLQQMPWSYFPAMRGGETSAFTGTIALDQVNRRYAVAPGLNSETRLVLGWNGVKTDFEDADVTPFDDRMAEAVGYFVLAKLSRVVDRDANQEAAYMRDYVKAKAHLSSEARWNAVVEDEIPSQMCGDTDYTASSDPTPANPLFEYMPLIVSLTGGGSTSLDGQVTEVDVAGDTVYFMVIDDIPTYYRLVDGDQVTSPGYVRPLDYNADTNARVWKQLS